MRIWYFVKWISFDRLFFVNSHVDPLQSMKSEFLFDLIPLRNEFHDRWHRVSILCVWNARVVLLSVGQGQLTVYWSRQSESIEFIKSPPSRTIAATTKTKEFQLNSIECDFDDLLVKRSKFTVDFRNPWSIAGCSFAVFALPHRQSVAIWCRGLEFMSSRQNRDSNCLTCFPFRFGCRLTQKLVNPPERAKSCLLITTSLSPKLSALVKLPPIFCSWRWSSLELCRAPFSSQTDVIWNVFVQETTSDQKGIKTERELCVAVVRINTNVLTMLHKLKRFELLLLPSLVPLLCFVLYVTFTRVFILLFFFSVFSLYFSYVFFYPSFGRQKWNLKMWR